MPSDSRKIGFLVLATSSGRENWGKIEDSYLYTHTVGTSLNTLTPGHQYTFYIGVDYNDRLFSPEMTERVLGDLIRKQGKESMVSVRIIVFNPYVVPKGYCTLMWNILHRQAYNDNNDYFYQCGDDIVFSGDHWIEACLRVHHEYQDVCVTGLENGHPTLLTQAFISRKHMEIFGFLFPTHIKNWFCDDWLNEVYGARCLRCPSNSTALNKGGDPRYAIDCDPVSQNNVALLYPKLESIKKVKDHLVIEGGKLLHNYLNSRD